MSKTARKLFKQSTSRRSDGFESGLSSAPVSDDDGYNSEGSVLSLDDYSPPGTPTGVEIDYAEELNQQLDALLEKRASTREAALATLIQLLGTHYLPEELDAVADTALDYLLRCVKRDKAVAENVLAAKALSLYFITLGPGHESRYAELAATALPLLTKPKADRSDAVRAALSESLTAGCFVTGTPDDAATLITAIATTSLATYRHMLSRATTSSATAAAAAALSATSGVAKVTHHATASTAATALPGARLLPPLLAHLGALCTVAGRTAAVHVAAIEHAPTYVRLLSSPAVSSEAKVLAAENVALFHEVGALGSTDVEESTTEGDEEESHHPLIERIATVLGDVMGGAGTETSVKAIAQRDRKSQRAAFRDVLSYLDSDVAPSLKLKFRKENVVLSTWCQLRQLYLFRTILGAQVHVHFLRNPLMRDVFGFTADLDAGLSKQERRFVHHPSSEASRAKTMHLAKQRQVRASKITHFED
ncbi:interferon-related developmental regulator-domain-containing protein [Blastocladiella britannica]|nr:interferon-related developmental regulator-domain-containing protein [Blastocladiella britannica]